VAAYRVRKAPRDVTRLWWFALRGHGRWITKAWTYTTHGDLRSDARAARLAGDQETRRIAQETIRADSRARWAKVGLALRRGLGAGLGVAFLAGVLTLVDSQVTRADMWPWLATVYTVLGVAGVVGLWVLKAVPVGWLVAAVWEGRDRTPGASWLHRPNRTDADSWIDERMISQALAHLGIGPLDRFFKAAGELVYTVPARVDGDGTYAQIRLPMGSRRTWSRQSAPPWPPISVGRRWRPGPPKVKKPACWICGSPTRGNSVPGPVPGHSKTTAPSTSSRASRWANPSGDR
jgi:S-DNA-T family DNA segregation ATPase FtsK/SpoIIIE